MGKSILTAKQSEFLELASCDAWITKNFYFTGGTALSEFYLLHRLSEDLDFFSLDLFNQRYTTGFLKKISSEIGIKKIEIKDMASLQIYYITFKNGEILKVDFSSYPFPPVGKTIYYNKLKIASIYDIAIDKVQTIFSNPRTRDYIDLYFIFKDNKFSLSEMLKDITKKFEIVLDSETLASQFVRVKDLDVKDFPVLLKPLNIKKMQEFFLTLTKSLGGKILLPVVLLGLFLSTALK